MHPILFHLGPLPIHTYGFLIAIGFLLAVQIVKRLAIRSKLDVDRILDLTFWCLMLGFLGARILFIITRWHHFMENPIDIFKVWEGGLVFLGGLVLVVPFAVNYVRRHKIDPWKAVDVLMPGLPIAQALGRLGCLAAGCCYGRPTNADWGVKLDSELVDLHMRGIYLHPTQLYESSAMFLLLFAMLYVFKHKKFDGQVGLTYFISYPIIRSIVEEFRGDAIRGFVIEDVLSTSQFISIIVFVIALGFLIYRLKTLKSVSVAKKN